MKTKGIEMKVLILGAGNIGTAIAHLFQTVNEYQVVLADQLFTNPIDKKIEQIKCDINDDTSFNHLLTSKKFDAIVSSLPYYCNEVIAKKAKQHHLHYFDLTEDVKTTEAIAKIAVDANTVFIPQCGIAPGFINIVANNFIQQHDHLESVQLRVGALPQNSSNALHYALTWSTDGLINQYGNLCESIVDGKYVLVKPLENCEKIILEGVAYEAFNTSGGLGTLWKSCIGKINNMNYKTLRYPGHCEKIKFLMNDLNLNKHRDVLKSMLEETVPKSHQDVVIVHVSVINNKNNRMIESNYTKKLYPATINNQLLTAIQLSTASGVCALVDMVLTKKYSLQGFIAQEQFSFHDFIENRFGKYYA